MVETIPGKNYMALELLQRQAAGHPAGEILGSQVYNEAKSMTLGWARTSWATRCRRHGRDAALPVAGTHRGQVGRDQRDDPQPLLYKAEAKDVRHQILIDPKMLELGLRGHFALLAPVVTDMKQAAHGLNWCVGEMERR